MATKTGSAMSSKQMAYSVKHGRKVIFTFLSGERRAGYICGEDSFHWRAVNSQNEIFLVHKSNVSVVDFPTASTYDGEKLKDDLELVVGPFRQFVETAHFGKVEEQ